MKVIFVFYFALLTIATSQYYYDRECPDDSDGTYPTCICHYAQYDEGFNKCINSVCPTHSNGTYPNCKCTENNFDYSIELNECFRVCPENSTGYWPNCVCNKKIEGFKPSSFECIACPPDSRNGSVYPNCDCGENGTYKKYSNLCEKCVGAKGIHPNCECKDKTAKYDHKHNACKYCPSDSFGVVPNCKCDGTAEYSVYENICVERTCPYDSAGDYPNCKCNDGFFEDNYCKKCPWHSRGEYPNCICDANSTYDNAQNYCYSCPEDSIDTYPNCKCIEESFEYDREKNLCFQCPVNVSKGIYPDCECENGLFGIPNGQCITCPATSTGIYPNCECIDDEYIFSAYINNCYIECPEDAQDIHPYCRCNDLNYHYDKNERVCRSNVGRKCPKLSIGIGPDCLCSREGYKFSSSLWGCYSDQAIYVQSFSSDCPNHRQKWPQCDVSIHRNALLSLVG